jgi:hypothetical protein
MSDKTEREFLETSGSAKPKKEDGGTQSPEILMADGENPPGQQNIVADTEVVG